MYSLYSYLSSYKHLKVSVKLKQTFTPSKKEYLKIPVIFNI